MKKELLVIGLFLFLISGYSVNALGKKLYFIEKDNKIVYENEEEDIFMQHLDMLPGSSYVDELEIENGTKTTYKLFLKVEEVEQNSVAIELLNSIDMKLYLDDLLIYDGKAIGLDYQDYGINLQDAILLKEFNKGDTALLRVETKLREEYSNKDNNDLSKINWVFYAQYENNEPEKIDGVPKTDRSSNLIIISIIVFLVGAFFISYYLKKRNNIIVK